MGGGSWEGAQSGVRWQQTMARKDLPRVPSPRPPADILAAELKNNSLNVTYQTKNQDI